MREMEPGMQQFGWRLLQAMQQERESKVKGQHKLCLSVLGGARGLSKNVIVSGTELTPAKTQNSTITSCPNDSYMGGECFLDISIRVSYPYSGFEAPGQGQGTVIVRA